MLPPAIFMGRIGGSAFAGAGHMLKYAEVQLLAAVEQGFIHLQDRAGEQLDSQPLQGKV